MTAINLRDAFLDAVADVVYARVLERWPASTASTPWMTAKQCAEYIGAGVGRIHDLVHVEQIPVHREGRRLMFDRDEIDAWIRAGGGKRP